VEYIEQSPKTKLRHSHIYAVEVRYPDEFDIPPIEEANECVEIALQIKDFILNKLNITEDEILRWIKETKQRG
jgi:hypothetical protein